MRLEEGHHFNVGVFPGRVRKGLSRYLSFALGASTLFILHE